MARGMTTQAMAEAVATQSWIRRMFEAGAELKQRLGADNVFDFSLGNPDLPAPEAAGQALHTLAERAGEPYFFGYVPNAGLLEVRGLLADTIGREQQQAVKPEDVLVTCGAAGALNVFLRTVLDPGDEVLCPAPYFAEYTFYAGHGGGILKTVPMAPPAFDLDPEALAAAIGPRTRVVLLNSPHNPTGCVYSQSALEALAKAMEQASDKVRGPLYLVMDEPYRRLAYDGVEVPSLFNLPYRQTIVASSFSKSLSLAGARIGYLALHPQMPGGAELMQGLILAQRTLGFVNAPIIAQRLLLEVGNRSVDVEAYAQRRAAMGAMLTEAGIEFAWPAGAFYFFPRVPAGMEEQALVQGLLEAGIIAVPGKGFGGAGHFRLSYCVALATIQRATPVFVRCVHDLRKAAPRP